MDRKYEFTGETKLEVAVIDGKLENRILHRIRAVRDFVNVKVGDLGGWIEKEENLSHEGNAWVADEAKVYGNAQVFDDAKIFEKASICGNAKVYGNASICGHYRKKHIYYEDNNAYYDDEDGCWYLKLNPTVVCGNAQVYDSAQVSNNAIVTGEAKIYGNAKVMRASKIDRRAQVYDSAQISDDAMVTGEAKVYGNAKVTGASKINSQAQVYENAQICMNIHTYESVEVTDRVQVYGNAMVCTFVDGNIEINGNVKIQDKHDLYHLRQVFKSKELAIQYLERSFQGVAKKYNIPEKTVKDILQDMKNEIKDHVKTGISQSSNIVLKQSIEQQAEAYMDNITAMELAEEMVMGD